LECDGWSPMYSMAPLHSINNSNVNEENNVQCKINTPVAI
jgi:hypothetical protein